jgi:hypothetical protein
MSSEYNEINERIVLAVQTLRSVTKPNIAAFARDHELPYQRLKRAYQGGNNRTTRPSTNKLLTDEQEVALKHFLDSIDDIGFGIHKSLVEQQCDALLALSHTGPGDPPRCGRRWAGRWLHAHKEYQRVRAKPIEIARKLAQQPEAIERWYEKLRGKIDEYGIQDEDQWNMDETGCQIGVGKGSYVWTRHGKQVDTTQITTRWYLT